MSEATTNRYAFFPTNTELADEPGMIQQVIASNSNAGYVGFRVRVPDQNMAAIYGELTAGNYPEIAALVHSTILETQRKLFKSLHMNRAGSVSEEECSIDAIEAFLGENKTVSISVKEWAELFSVTAAVITARVAEVKMLPATLTPEEIAAVAGPTVRHWEARWNMCRKAGGIVSDADRAKLREFYDDATVVAGHSAAVSRSIRTLLAGKAVSDSTGADVVEL